MSDSPKITVFLPINNLLTAWIFARVLLAEGISDSPPQEMLLWSGHFKPVFGRAVILIPAQCLEVPKHRPADGQP